MSPRTRWLTHTRMTTQRGGPIFWIHENLVCPDCNRVSPTALFVLTPPPSVTYKATTNAARTSPRASSVRPIVSVLRKRTLTSTGAVRGSASSAVLMRLLSMLRWGFTGQPKCL